MTALSAGKCSAKKVGSEAMVASGTMGSEEQSDENEHLIF
jgi:hypothetical protein